MGPTQYAFLRVGRACAAMVLAASLSKAKCSMC
jgi:hypothetical protein